ncbi:MBL fold metallo-hydrolase [Aquabacterium sp. J223]|uniref:MBL fold metallo-hydrolase n=1 Tax=Aquabacterium sp. J223 TaxID=2898431 RepID=UPI0021ADD27A|nr:MBL fold metallo-hydrolase [Aquabacterium sp. J223]UUX95178.1 MBL fold metallo-hydrolase [Aquabacterium sp. J223]
MTLRFCSLGSGSGGNATLVEGFDGLRHQRLLIDCGLSLRELSRRLGERGLAPAQLDAVFITHEHSDHVGGLRTLMRRHRVPVWTAEGTARAVWGDDLPPQGLHVARDGECIDLGLLVIEPFAVPHDAAEPLQLTVHDGASRLGVMTDIGHITSRMVQALSRCEALLLECNHELDLLHGGPYPWFLKRRIAGPRGHLANHDAAALLADCRHAGLRHVVAAHLSDCNNRPALAQTALAGALHCRADDIVVADPRTGCGWLSLR